MVCKKCEKKLKQNVICPDPWKEGSRNATKDRKVNENKILTTKRRFNPYQKQCRICKTTVPQEGCNYCQPCAYKKGVCAMCGKQILDTTMYKQSVK
ncbi:Cysteine-rich PDZ-binding protein [Balamuthia mandrillaris]